jgi:hypothetical protein
VIATVSILKPFDEGSFNPKADQLDEEYNQSLVAL